MIKVIKGALWLGPGVALLLCLGMITAAIIFPLALSQTWGTHTARKR